MGNVSFGSDGLLFTAVSCGGADVTRIELTGELDRASAPQLATTVEAALASRRPRSVVLDLSGLRFLDVGGARAVGSARKACRAVGSRCELANPSSFVRKVLQATGEWDPATGPAGADACR